MAEKREYRVDVRQKVDFHALENPPWRTRGKLSCDVKTVEQMVSDIMKFHKRWKEEENKYDQKMVKEVKDKFFLEFVTHVNKEEERGVSTIE